MSEMQVPGQLDLLGGPEQAYVPHQRHSPTSHAAAVAKRPTAAQQREAVFRFIVDHWPCSDDAIQQGLGIPGDSERPRRIELLRAGRIVQDGEALTASGRKAATWRPT